MALAAGLLGLLVGARCGAFGLLAGAVLVGLLSQSGLFHDAAPGLLYNLGLLLEAIVAFEAVALGTMLLKHRRRVAARRIVGVATVRG